MPVEINLRTAATRAEAHRAVDQVLTALGRRTAEQLRTDAPRVSGFLAGTVASVPPGAAGIAAATVATDSGPRTRAAVPGAATHEAYVAIAAAYALFADLRSPFVFPVLNAILARLDDVLADIEAL